jgi:hypothetical protein
MGDIKRAIILLDIMTREDYEYCIGLHGKLASASAEEVWSHYAVIGAPHKPGAKISKKSPLVETYLLIHHLKRRGIPYWLWYDNSLALVNDTLYRFGGDGPVEEPLEGACLITLRDSWRHPFFGILEVLLREKGGRLAKPNPQTMRNTGCMNKFYALRELYPMRATWLHDIAVPYNLKKRFYPAFLELLSAKMGRRVVFKTDCVQQGHGVVFCDLKDPNLPSKVQPLLEKHMRDNQELFVTPAYRISKEFRCYFTRGDMTTVFSIKCRVNDASFDELATRDNLQIYKNIKVKWHQVAPGTEDHTRATEIAQELVSRLSYNAGCVEFALTEDGRSVFFEVNQMAGPLPFHGKDVALTTAYYHSMFEIMLGEPKS